MYFTCDILNQIYPYMSTLHGPKLSSLKTFLRQAS